MTAKSKHGSFDTKSHRNRLLPLLLELEVKHQTGRDGLQQLLRKYPKLNQGYFKKTDLIKAYRYFAGKYGLKPFDPGIIQRIQMKPVRTISGVTPVTVLTKPFPCPGKCIFCPSDIKMPKSYIASEPGAQRAEKNHFDPYLQTYSRIQAYQDIGHSIDKVELIVLGGTWSFYPEKYKIWFITRLFEALNDFAEGIDQRPQIKPSIDLSQVDSETFQKEVKTSTYNQVISKAFLHQELAKRKANSESSTWRQLEKEQIRNQTAKVRCVGLVLETRPDYISNKEVITLRRLGCTKTQIGLQSLQDDVLDKNKRGHDVAASRRAINLLRAAGFKIHAHWMPNLYGSSVTQDIEDYRQLFFDPDFKPDELKIYPTSLIEDTPLMDIHRQGKWRPYTHQELLHLIGYCLTHTPEFCRLTRIVRDIPSQEIVTGNKFTNFRQIATDHVKKSRGVMRDIRAREIRNKQVDPDQLTLKTSAYRTTNSIEYFLQFVAPGNHIAGFLRLSLPQKKPFIKEIRDSALIREVHVYGQSLKLQSSQEGAAQHIGLGTNLMHQAEQIARENGFLKISVISAVGTRAYYQKLGYKLKTLYQHKNV